MEDNTISLNCEAILKKVFTPNVKGYDPDEVDAFLDRVAQDYKAFEAYYTEAREYVAQLETQLRSAREKASELEVELARYKQRLEGIKDSDGVNMGNIDLMQRINRLEAELFRLGVDPRKI